MLKDYTLPPFHGGKPSRAVIFLHGVGDSGSGGLLSIGQIWQRELKDCEFLCPDAPFPFDMAPPGFAGRQWFSLKDFTPTSVLEGAQNAAPHLNEYLDHVLATRSLTPERVALVGFSQGTMMALYVALRRAPAFACIVGYSGLLIAAETLATEKRSAPPVLLVHGQMDDVVPYGAMAVAEEVLKNAGISVTTLTCPETGHNVDDAGLIAGMKFIKRIWG